MFIDYGHPRSGNAPQVEAAYDQHRLYDWFAYYVKGDHRVKPPRGVEAITSTCSGRQGVTYYARSWVSIHPGEVRYRSAPPRTIVSAGGDPTVSAAIDPIAAAQARGQSDCVTTRSGDEPGTANWRLATVGGRGYTLLGSPTVIADLAVRGAYPELAARLWDIAPTGTQTLIARGLYRPAASCSSCTPTRGTSVPATSSSSSYWAGMPLTHAGPVGLLRSPCLNSISGSQSTNAQGRGQVHTPVPLIVPCGQTPAPGLVAVSGCANSFFLATPAH